MNRYLRSISMTLILLLPILTAMFATLSVDGFKESTKGPMDGSFQRPMEKMTIELEFGHPKLELTSSGIEIEMAGASMDRRVSYLRLPVHNIERRMPVGTEILDIDLKIGAGSSFFLPGPIANNPHPISASDDGTGEHWGLKVKGPDSHLEWDVRTGKFEGVRKALISIRLNPIIVKEDTASFFLDGSIEISYRESEIENGGILSSPRSYDMIIICPAEFRTLADEFSAYRNSTGISTMPISLEEIWSDDHFTVNGADRQEDIKLFIHNATREWNISFVLLAGDVDRIPARHILVLDENDDSGSSNRDGAFVPSDLYYSDIFEGGTYALSTWNEYVSGDHLYLWGEFDGSALDGPDLVPDVDIGRMPASTLAEMELLFAKVRAYELSAKGSDWIFNATLGGADVSQGDGTLEGEHLGDHIAVNYLQGYNVSRYYESYGNLNNVTRSLQNHTGFAVLSDHGEYNGWGYTSNHSGVIGLSEVSGMDNGAELPVILLDASLTHGFDNENASDDIKGKDPIYNQWYYPPGSIHRGRDSLAEYFHLARRGGAVATFGSTRVSFGSPGASYANTLSGYMADRIMNAMNEGMHHPGTMLAKAVSDYVGTHGASTSQDYKTVTQYILLGDPSLTIGGIDPLSLNITTDSDLIHVAPGSNSTVSFQLRNDGKVNATIDLSVDIPDNNLIRWTAGISLNSTTIGPGSTINGSINISAPADAWSGQQRTIQLVIGSVLLLESISYDITAEASLTIGVEVNATPGEFKAFQGSEISGFIHLENIGNAHEIFHIEVLDIPDGWTVFIPQMVVNASPFQTNNIPFKISIPDPALAQIYHISIQVGSNITYANDTMLLKVEVEKETGLAFIIPSSALMIGIDGKGNTTIRLLNRGNSPVMADVDWFLPGSMGWLISLSTNRSMIPAFGELTIGIEIIPPAGTFPDTYPLFLIASNGTDQIEGGIDIIVPKEYDYSISLDNKDLVMNRDSTGGFYLNISNTGNIYDRYSLKVDWIDTDNITVEPEDEEFSVSYASFRSIWFEVAVGDPLNGSYAIQVRVIPLSNAVNRSVIMTLRVRQSYNFSVEKGTGRSIGSPGGQIKAVIDVINEGNTMDRFDVALFVPVDWTIDISTTVILIDPKDKGSIEVDVGIPNGTLAGEYVLQVVVRSIGSNTTRAYSFDLHVDEVYDLETSLLIGQRPLILKRGTLFTISLSVKNNGNSIESVDIGLSTSDHIRSWVTLSFSTLTGLEPGENRTITIRIDVPRNVTSGSYDLTVFISSKGDIRAEKEEITLFIEDRSSGGILSSINIVPVAVTLIVGLLLILIVVAVVIKVYRRSSGVDLKDAGMEWEEDEE